LCRGPCGVKIPLCAVRARTQLVACFLDCGRAGLKRRAQLGPLARGVLACLRGFGLDALQCGGVLALATG